MNKLNKLIEQIKTKEDFFSAPAKTACWYAYVQYKSKKWTKAQFDERLREWWRINHGLIKDLGEELTENLKQEGFLAP